LKGAQKNSLTLRESKLSFAIEVQADQLYIIYRFADVLARRTGLGDGPLDGAALGKLLSEILGIFPFFKGHRVIDFTLQGASSANV